ncbi:MAG: hypothetical protein K5871_02045 [Lachnospiraceae bacterium]|nr:hypothetical protein [Lachnospiraceae bacterium]
MPISDKDGKVIFSDICKDLILQPYEFITNSIDYYGFSFNDDGSFSGYCNLYASLSERDQNGSVTGFYKVQWSADGKCISIVECTEEVEFEDYHTVRSLSDGANYSIASSGVSRVDAEGNYLSKYFDFINSDMVALGFEVIAVRDDDSFSGIYKDAVGNTVLACFNRNADGFFNRTAILLACTDLDISLMEDIYNYNIYHKDFRITVYDYSDRAISGTPQEAWDLLKSDIEGGLSPDIILNSTGYDKDFISTLCADDRLSELSDVIYKDSELKGISFSDKASELFYEKDKIYAVVPSYSYDTVLGQAGPFDVTSSWDISAFSSFTSTLPEYKYAFDNDTQVTFIQKILFYDGYDYVDYRNGTASFDSEGFTSLLNYASTLPADISAINLLRNSESYQGGALIAGDWIRIGDIHLDATKFCQGQYIDIGFPSDSNPSGVISADCSFMVMSGNANTNECWTIIRRYLTSEYQTDYTLSIPVTAEGYAAWKENVYPTAWKPEDFVYTLDGVEYTVFSPNEDEAAYIVSKIEKCDKMAFSDYYVEQIVMDYAAQFFEGTISAEQAAQSIDRDVEAYLNS